MSPLGVSENHTSFINNVSHFFSMRKVKIGFWTRCWVLPFSINVEKAMALYSSTLAWKIPWTEKPGGLQSMGSLRVRHDWATSLSLLLSCIGEGNGNPLQCSCLENPRDGAAWWAAVYGVAQSQTRLKQLSSSRQKANTKILALNEAIYQMTLRYIPNIWSKNNRRNILL